MRKEFSLSMLDSHAYLYDFRFLDYLYEIPARNLLASRICGLLTNWVINFFFFFLISTTDQKGNSPGATAVERLPISPRFVSLAAVISDVRFAILLTLQQRYLDLRRQCKIHNSLWLNRVFFFFFEADRNNNTHKHWRFNLWTLFWTECLLVSFEKRGNI